MPSIVPVALGIPVVMTMPVVPETTIVTQSGPVALLPENPAPPDLVAAAFGKQTDPQASAQAQVGSSLLTLASGPDGSSQMALTLHPKELGAVHIQLDRNSNGVIRIVVTASEPATLRSLINDQAHLHAALDAASIPSAGRTLSFELGIPPAGPAVTPGHAAFPSVVERVQDTVSAPQTDARTNVDMSGFRSSDPQAGNGGRDPGNAFSRSGRDPGSDSDAGDTDDSPTISKSSSLARRSSGGINITA
ncbi:MAG: flagellar hook-length control protein FliK [Janthinobacterium lividum]